MAGALVPAVIARLKAEVTTLRSVEGAKSFLALMKSRALPQVTPAAHVLPTGIQGGRADAISGAFTQGIRESVAVILTIRSNDRLGEGAIDDIDGLIHTIVAAIAGWAPGNETGVFELVRAQPLNVDANAFVYQIEFAIQDQLRILS